MQRYDSRPKGLSVSARARAGYLCAALALCVAYPLSVAVAGGPSGGTVAAGSATISNPNANTTNIDQTSEKVIINWQNFSIPSDSAVNFSQPNAAAIALNRVTGGDLSSIEGSLTANGNVWIINPNGILFGKGAEINVGSLIATTADIDDSDFMNGQYNFTKAGNPNASIDNEGTIHAADGGSVVLAGPVVSNNGLIEADVGSVTLAGTQAFTVDFQGDNLIRFQMAAPASETGTPDKLSVSNAGKISAKGGHVLMTVRAAESVADSVINNTGMVEATSVHNENGTIVLDAGDGEADVSGTLDASGKDAGQTGGSVSVTGKTVAIAGNTKIDASGSAGGGKISIGGDLHGAGPTPNAQTTTVGNATLSADATGNGNGGTIAVWSDQSTQFAGSASARGAGTGNGGFVETSGGSLTVADSAHVDTSAPAGLTGDWLLDPSYISIETGGSDGVGCAYSFCTIAPDTITGALNTTNVTLQASSEIDVYNDISYTSANTLSLLSQGDIYVAANIQNAGAGAINVVAGWNGTTTDPAQFGNAGVYGQNGGSVYVTSDYDLDPDEAYNSEDEEGEAHEVAVGSAGGATLVAGDNIEVLGSFGNSQIGYNGTGGGDINVYAVDAVTLTASSCSNCYAQIGNGGIGYNGVMSGAVTVHAGGDVTLTSGASVYSYAQIGNGGDSSGGNASGDVLVQAGGAVNLYGDGDYAQIGNGGWAFNGDSSGMVTVNAGGDVALTGGSTSPYGYTQIGNGGQSSHGDSSGDIYVQSGGAITLVSENDSENYALIGNGGFPNTGDSVSGNASGNVTLWAQDNLQFDICSDEVCTNQGMVWIGNAAPSGVASGDLTVIAADQKDNCMVESCHDDFGSMVGSALGDDSNGNYIDGAGGNVTIAYTDPQHNDGPELNIDTGVSYDSPFDLTIMSGNNIDISGSLQNAGTGNLTLVAGWNLDEVTPEDIIAQAAADASMAALFAGNAAAYGANGGSILIGGTNACQDAEGVCGSAAGSAGGTTSVFGSDITVEADNGYAQIGYNGTGGGTIVVRAANDLNLTAYDGELAAIGNGYNGKAGNATGNIDARAGNQLQLYENGGNVWIGNSALGEGAIATGNVTVIAGSEDDNFDIGTIIATDLGDDSGGHYIDGAGGNVTFAFTSLEGDQKIDGGAEYDSPYTLSIVSNMGLNVSGSLVNDGTGALNIVAGWNPAIVTPDQLVNATNGSGGAMAALFAAHASAYGNNGATVTISDPTEVIGDPSVGSAGGTTSVFTDNLTIQANNAVAQLGTPDGSGDIAVYAKDTISLTGNSSDALAEIGNGTTSAPGGGNITINAQALTVNAHNAVLGDTATINITGTNGIGDLADPLRLWLNSIAITADGGGVFATSPGSGISIGVGSYGINLDGGALTLSADGAITQTQAIVASALNVSTGGGTITLSNTGNAFGTLTVSTTGSDNATIYDAGAVTVASAGVGGTFALTATGAIGQSGVIAAHALSATSTGGAITLTNSGNFFASLAVSTSASNDANIKDSTGVSVTSAQVGGTFTLTAAGAIGQSGDIIAAALNVSSTGGAITLNNSGDAFATLSVATSGSNNASVNDSTGVTVASAHAGGTFTLTSAGAIGQNDPIIANALNVTSTGGAVTLNDPGNAFGALTLAAGANSATVYDTIDLTVNGATANGGLTLLTKGNLTFVNSVQVTGGNLLAVAGWDGTTTNAAAVTAGNAYGNNNGSIVIGGAGASGGVAAGASGTATLAANNITLSAVNGYAQFGLNGNGTGALSAIAKGNVALNAGDATGEDAQIGNGGYQATGSNSGAITVAAAGDVDLTGGSGTDTYAQIGHGGGQSNANSAGYSDAGAITITAANVNLSAGSGSGAYAQAGNGGYRAGAGLTGAATISGAIAVTVSHTVNLNGGAGANAFAQIGNGGGFANTNSTSSASGTTSGDIVVTAPNGSSGGVSVTAGAGGNAYAQIGNGGYSSNAPSAATPASFVISGNVTVTDLVLAGGGANAYSQVGNGDIGHASVGDIFGNIVIDTGGGPVTLTPGTGPGSFALIENATGSGSVSGTVSGYLPPQNAASGTIASLTSSPQTNVPTDNTADAVVLQEQQQSGGGTGAETGGETGPLEDLTDSSGQGDQESSEKSDKTADALGDSLDGSKKKSASEVYLSGLVTKLEPATPANTPHGIPPADSDFASWGNEAFWQ